MKIKFLEKTDQGKWDSLALEEPSFALLQSWAWGEFKEGLGWQAFRVGVESNDRLIAGAQMLLKQLPLKFWSIAYIPRGPIGEWQNPAVASLLFDALNAIARKLGVVFLRIEPPVSSSKTVDDLLQSFGFIKSGYTNQPRATILLDLQSNLDQIIAGMQSKTRYNIRYAAKKSVEIRVGDSRDLQALQRLVQNLGRKAGFPSREIGYIRREFETFQPLNQVRLLVASFQGEVLAAHLHAIFGRHAAYLHGASANMHKNLMPNHLLMWEAIKWAKSEGCQTFDFWGIPDEVGHAFYTGEPLPSAERTDGLWGVYRFKKGFSSDVRFYASAHDYVYNSSVYKLAPGGLLNGGFAEQIAVWIDRF